MTVDLRSWLEGMGLGEHHDAFVDNAVTADLLPSLTADDLKDMGIAKVGDRRRLLNAIAALGEPAATVAPAASAVEAVPSQPERRQLTILVADIVGSTALATRLDPEELRRKVAGFQQRCADAVREFGGHVGPFLGDAVIAYFGFPRTLENDVESALRAGLAIVGRRSPQGDGEPLRLRVGVATGVVIVGRLDDTGSLPETVIGDTPNLAVRLQAHAEPDTVVCGAVARALAADLFVFTPLGRVEAKGFDEPVELFRVDGESDLVSRFAATRPRTIARLVGRVEERALLRERWATASRGEGQAVVIVGQSGIGKSRLIGSLVDDVGAEGGQTAVLQCSPLFTESPLYPVVRHLEATAGVGQGDTPRTRLAKLRRLMANYEGDPELAQQLAPLLVDATGLAGQPTPEQARANSLSAFVRLILESARRRPLLLVVEDVHWSDPSTREFLQRLLAAFRDHALMTVITARPDSDLAWTRSVDPLVIELAKLNRAQAAEFLQEIFEDRAISIPVARRIIDRTDGVPLFIEEVCGALIESGALQPDTNARIDPDVVLARVPVTLYDTLLTRLDRDPRAKGVAQVAAVIGREFHIELLRALLAGNETELETGLGALLQAGLVHPVAHAEPGLFAFKHGLMHQAAYETLLLTRREALHRRVVELVPEMLPDLVRSRPELLARHLSLAGEPERAAAQWLLAGRQALGRGAYEEAKQHLHAGLEAAAQLDAAAAHAATELELQITLAQVLRSARFTGGDEALDACRRGRHLADQLGRHDELLKALRLEFGILFNRPEIEAAAAIARAFAETTALAELPQAQVLGLQSMGKVHFFRGELRAAEAAMDAALADRATLATDDLLTHHQYPVSAMVYGAFAKTLLGQSEMGADLLDQALAVSRTSAPFTHSLTLANALLIDLARGGSGERPELLGELARIAAARGAPFWTDLVGFHDGWYAVHTDTDVENGLARMHRGLVTFAENAVEIEVPFYEAILAAELLRLGRYAEGGRLLDDAEARIARTRERWALVEVLRLRLIYRARTGHGDDLTDLLAEARAVATTQDAGWWRQRLEATAAELGLAAAEPVS